MLLSWIQNMKQKEVRRVFKLHKLETICLIDFLCVLLFVLKVFSYNPLHLSHLTIDQTVSHSLLQTAKTFDGEDLTDEPLVPYLLSSFENILKNLYPF